MFKRTDYLADHLALDQPNLGFTQHGEDLSWHSAQQTLRLPPALPVWAVNDLVLPVNLTVNIHPKADASASGGRRTGITAYWSAAFVLVKPFEVFL